MMMMMAMTMMTNIIPYCRTKTHIWEKVLMGIWASAEIINTITMNIIMIITCRYPGLGGGMPGMNGPGIGCCAAAHYKDARMIKFDQR